MTKVKSSLTELNFDPNRVVIMWTRFCVIHRLVSAFSSRVTQAFATELQASTYLEACKGIFTHDSTKSLVTLAQLGKASVGQADVRRFEPHLRHNWLSCGVFLVKSRHFGLPWHKP